MRLQGLSSFLPSPTGTFSLMDLTTDHKGSDPDKEPYENAYDKAVRDIRLRMGFVAKYRFGGDKRVPRRRFAHPRCPNLKEGPIKSWLRKHKLKGSNWVQELPMDIEWLKFNFGCSKMAGQGTSHPGFGLCKYCEAKWMEKHGVSKGELNELAEDHAEVLSRHGASGYVAPDHAVMQFREDEEAAVSKMKLYDEVGDAMVLVNQIMAALRGEDENGEPLTMYVKGELQEMDSKTKMELAAKFLTNSGRLKEIHDRMEARHSIPADKFTAYISRLASVCQQYVPKELWANFAAELNNIPNPAEKR